MEPWKALLALPLVMLLIIVGALMSDPNGGQELFPYAWFGFTATFTVAFIVMIRWGFGPEEADLDEGGPGEAH